jgi:hypothetical protein
MLYLEEAITGLSRGFFSSLVSILMSDAVSVSFVNQRVRKNNTVVFIFISNMSSQELYYLSKMKYFAEKLERIFFNLNFFVNFLKVYNTKPFLISNDTYVLFHVL